MSQVELAEVADMSRTTVRKLLYADEMPGDPSVNLDTLERFLAGLGILPGRFALLLADELADGGAGADSFETRVGGFVLRGKLIPITPEER